MQTEVRFKVRLAADGRPANSPDQLDAFLSCLASQEGAIDMNADRLLSSIDQILRSPRVRLTLPKLSGIARAKYWRNVETPGG
jgi:hypothetical protein